MRTISTLLLGIFTWFAWGQVNQVDMYIFGHSLIDHRPPITPTPADETTVPHWLEDIATAAGKTYTATGQYGFLPNHLNLPPSSQWGYTNVSSPWDDSTQSFAAANMNTIMLTVGNFIQYVPSNGPHPIDNTITTVSGTENLFDWCNNQEPGMRYYLYANWPEMDLQQAYPPTVPTSTEIASYHTQTIGTFTTWWEQYQDALLMSRPQLDVRLIPVGKLISEVMTQVIPGQVPFTEWYEDSAPHGRPSLYFIAAIITYMAIYEEPLPAGYTPSNQVHPGVRNNLAAIQTYIWNELLNYNLPNGDSRVFYNTPLSNDHTPNNTPLYIIQNHSSEIVEFSKTISDYQLQLYTLSGQPISINIRSHNTIDLSDIASGLYVLRATHLTSDRQYVFKIIR